MTPPARSLLWIASQTAFLAVAFWYVGRTLLRRALRIEGVAEDGRYDQQKGIDHLLRALAVMRTPPDGRRHCRRRQRP